MERVESSEANTISRSTAIKLKREHIEDISARIALIQHYLSLVNICEVEANKLHYAAIWINEPFTYCLETGIASDKPDELRSWAARVEKLVELRNKEVEKQNFWRSVAEGLQESLSFWLAERYGFDPMKDQVHVDLGGKNLIIHRGQEQDGNEGTQ